MKYCFKLLGILVIISGLFLLLGCTPNKEEQTETNKLPVPESRIETLPPEVNENTSTDFLGTIQQDPESSPETENVTISDTEKSTEIRMPETSETEEEVIESTYTFVIDDNMGVGGN